MSRSRWEKRLQQEIGSASDPEMLQMLRNKEQNRLLALVSISPINSVVDAMNELQDAIISRALELVENDLARLGLGAPPVPYAYFLFGSGGRSEQTMTSDQDSGIVYANPANDDEKERCELYFEQFGQTAVQYLVRAGYPPCEGNVIASNPEWRLSLHDWERKIDGYFNEPSWENVRHLLIIADGRKVAGDISMAEEFRERFFSDMLSNSVIVRRMMENTLRHKVLVGAFGQLLRERYGKDSGSLDIKYGAYIPMVNAFRLLAVQAGIHESSTLGRIAGLQHAGVLTLGEAEEASSAFSFLLRLRLLTLGNGKIPRDQLTKELTQPLKKALKIGKKVQRKVERELQYRFGGR
ncbi:DUF294 nucleotidyltransferase-like domain-containing protein [Cohnella faecalis]|uniref:Signal transduction protein n=1 Tax=Cohnella faecalis TaxID=2315694 RepID=A0A398CCY9_9BACL|nr:DUF294 nucleotidyltransferase-like domain-containing protein [Cohnella faecalis]RIE00580.1 hypothetical protein D3H35_28000 [Cohnella faecalis]